MAKIKPLERHLCTRGVCTHPMGMRIYEAQVVEVHLRKQATGDGKVHYNRVDIDEGGQVHPDSTSTPMLSSILPVDPAPDMESLMRQLCRVGRVF